jgi:hypothetical protein
VGWLEDRTDAQGGCQSHESDIRGDITRPTQRARVSVCGCVSLKNGPGRSADGERA